MADRASAVWRVAALVLTMVVYWIAYAIGAVVLALFMIGDVLTLLITGDNLNAGSNLSGSIWDWIVGNNVWILLGDGNWEWLPS